jgi:hypothetical protein
VGVVNSYALNELNDAALVSETDVVGLTPATVEEIEHWQDVSMSSYPIYNMDDSELKMVARGNPAVVYLQDGVIQWKRTLSSLEGIEQPYELSEMGRDYDAEAIISRLMIYFMAAMLALLLINRTYPVIRHIFFRKKPTTKNPTTNETKD